MPPKAKFTKEQICFAGLNIIREKGADCLTARELGKKLGSSACPIFTVFENMEQVYNATVQSAKNLYAQYVKEGLKETPAFKGVGTQYIKFAIKEPRLFELLFMSQQPNKLDINNVLPIIEEHYSEILLSVQKSYGVNNEIAKKIYRHLWVYTHGIAVLCVTKMCVLTAEEIETMIYEVLKGLLQTLKGE